MIYQKHFTVLLIVYIFLTSSGEIDICSNHDNYTGENKVYSRADFYLVRHTVPQTEANRNNMAPAPDKNPVVNPFEFVDSLGRHSVTRECTFIASLH